MSVYIHDCNATNYSPSEVENVGLSPYTHAPVHPEVNGYRILARSCDLPFGVVTWHLPRQGVQRYRYKQYSMESVQCLYTRL